MLDPDPQPPIVKVGHGSASTASTAVSFQGGRKVGPLLHRLREAVDPSLHTGRLYAQFNTDAVPNGEAVERLGDAKKVKVKERRLIKNL